MKYIKSFTIMVVLFSCSSQMDNNLTEKQLIDSSKTEISQDKSYIEKFSNGFEPLIHRGLPRIGMPQRLKNRKIIITTYDPASQDVELLKAVHFDLLISNNPI